MDGHQQAQKARAGADRTGAAARGDDYDAVIVGASLAGCAAATLLGREGLKVALVDKRPDPSAYKLICSHYIQSSAVPTLQRLGIVEELERMGAVRSRGRIWTRWGWIVPPADMPLARSINIRRQLLDPFMRQLAAQTPGVELVLGCSLQELISEDEAVAGALVADRNGRRLRLRARLTVGADGRGSRTAELAGVRERHWPHGRVAYAAYYEGPPPEGAPDASLWLLDPHMAAAFPTDEGLTTYACMPTRDRLPQFKADPEGALRSFVSEIPDAPPILSSRRAGPVLGKVDMTNVMRAPTAPGLALVGDAALATDPLWGVGCGFALQGAEWLADSVAGALQGRRPLDDGLAAYRARHRRGLHRHAGTIHDYATGRRMNAGERLVFSAAPGDVRLSSLFERFGTRNVDPARFLAEAVPRALAVHARRALTPRLRPGPSAPRTAEAVR